MILVGVDVRGPCTGFVQSGSEVGCTAIRKPFTTPAHASVGVVERIPSLCRSAGLAVRSDATRTRRAPTCWTV